jgi:hypothetical protein
VSFFNRPAALNDQRMQGVRRRTCASSSGLLVLAATGFLIATSHIPAAGRVEILDSTGGVPTRLVADLLHEIAFVETSKGEALVLDAGAHGLFSMDAGRSRFKRVIPLGGEPGHILKPSALAIGLNDIVAIVDAPAGHDRLQYFGADGGYISGFYVPNPLGSRLAVGPVVVNGIGSLQFNGKTFFVSTPHNGALIMEVGTDGLPVRSIGELRPTGHESDASLHFGLNLGLPLIDPRGGFYFVFQTGRPMFRKYDAAGQLLFERHIEGVELDAALKSLPTTWPSRPDNSIPYVPSLVRTAGVDPAGQLWVSLTVPYTYIYDRAGEKIRTVQFRSGGSLVSPTSVFFARGDRVLVTPGCLEFSSRPGPVQGIYGMAGIRKQIQK